MGVTGPQQPQDFPRKTHDSQSTGADSGALAIDPLLAELIRLWPSLSPAVRYNLLSQAQSDAAADTGASSD
jgi:hypothetical protein